MKLAVVVGGYTPGEADQLRRDMGAWRRSGKMEKHHEKLVREMTARGIEPKFAEDVFKQILGFGEYGFPESHAASFALLAYATSYLRCHFPAEFACALLNALPMGFYPAAAIVNDAKRHGVEVRPADVSASSWECSLETATAPAAVRIGLKFVRGLRADDAERIVAARTAGPFASIEDFAERTKLDRRAQPRLAEAGAFESLGGRSRRGDLWRALAPPEPAGDGLPLDLAEAVREFAPLPAFDTIDWDYRMMNLSARGHSLEFVRDRLRAQRLPDAGGVSRMPNGRRVDYAGMVTCRQRPQTASDVLFMTLEDETGFVNLVVWPRVYERQSVLVRTASFLGVTGKVQNEKGVVHVVAESFWKPDIGVTPPSSGSHDFH